MGCEGEEYTLPKDFILSPLGKGTVCFWLYTGQLYHVKWKHDFYCSYLEIND